VDTQPGLYRHFKGKTYRVLGRATSTESGEDLVIYMDAAGGDWWARAEQMFHEKVVVDGRSVPRFSRIDEGGHDVPRGR